MSVSMVSIKQLRVTGLGPFPSPYLGVCSGRLFLPPHLGVCTGSSINFQLCYMKKKNDWLCTTTVHWQYHWPFKSVTMHGLFNPISISFWIILGPVWVLLSLRWIKCTPCSKETRDSLGCVGRISKVRDFRSYRRLGSKLISPWRFIITDIENNSQMIRH